MANIRDLVQSDTQTRILQIQVWRNGQWINIPVSSAQAKIGRNKGGELNLEIPDNGITDPRSQLYEGERIRVFRGVVGAAPVRCWTGYVDIRSPQMGSGSRNTLGRYRQVTVTDNIKELIDAKFLAGVIYDGWAPNAAAADAVQRAINTGQFMVYDDLGNQLTSTASYNQVNGNGICYFPDLFNDDGSLYTLPMGTTASFGTAASNATFVVPVAASGCPYGIYEASKQHFIASTMVITGSWTVASTAQSMPPPRGTVIVDCYNGIFYFNPADASSTINMYSQYYDRPLLEVKNGTPVNDIVQQIWTTAGCQYYVDGAGKLQAVFQDVVKAPKRVFNSSNAADLGVQINRDRRNVILCLGWDTTCPGVIAAKAINYDDIQNAPPKGLGKRAYMYLQDKKWNTMFTVTRAALYALMRVSKRGKIASVKVLDDPGIYLNDVIAFSSIMPEIDPNDFFYIEEIEWQLIAKNNKIEAVQSLMGNAIPGQGTFYLGPVTGATSEGQYDLTADVRAIFNCALIPAGGSYNSTFSLAAGLQLQYSVSTVAGLETITYYRPDGTSVVLDQNAARSASTQYTVPITLTGINPGDLVVVKLYFKDNNGNIGVYRDWITAAP